MRKMNQSLFLLLGLSWQPQQQQPLFLLFLIMYLATVLGNLLIILAISTDSRLHTPMYFFLCNLSFVDVCFSSTTVPKYSMPEDSCPLLPPLNKTQFRLRSGLVSFLISYSSIPYPQTLKNYISEASQQP
uniref:G-protein coupled receptors family 1 profile domain-containing protein n=1 Tax=Nannospalax galili TaxID=1026970 RepID=A0A8C6RV33_NANGA